MRSNAAVFPLATCLLSAAASRPQYREESLLFKRQTSFPAGTPCSSNCNPFLTAAGSCNAEASCLCTTAIYQELQSCITCLGTVGGSDSTVASDIESTASAFNQKCSGAVPSVTIPVSAAANTAIPDSSDAGGFSAGDAGFGASSDGSDFNTFSDDSFHTDGSSDASPTIAGGFGAPATAAITVAGAGGAPAATNANPFAPAAATANAGTGAGSSGLGSGSAGSGNAGSGNSGSGNAPGSAQAAGGTKAKSTGYYTARMPSIQHVENVALVVTTALLLNL